MDASWYRYAYRCVPLTIANTSGWEILCPDTFMVKWDGRESNDAITIFADKDGWYPDSRFGSGIITFSPGYLFRTPPGWAIWMRGSPNALKDGIVPLEGVVETDWVELPATMSWKFTTPGTVKFEAGEPFCFLTLLAHTAIEEVRPVIRALETNPELKDAFEARAAARVANSQKPGTQRWDMSYAKGRLADGSKADAYHVVKRRLKSPVEEI
jgi:hypothetical protein